MTETRPLRAYAEVVLGRQRSPQHDEGPDMVPYLRAANVKDGALDLTDVKEMNFTSQEQQVFRLEPGDVLVTEGSGSLRAVGAASVWNGELDGTVCFQNTLLRLRPRPSTDPRYLAWWCRFAFADGLFASIATGANIFHVSAERVRSLPMTYLSIQRQRAIADTLDVEAARIDALIAAKRRMIEVLGERWRACLNEAFSVPSGLRFKRLLSAPLAYGVLVPRHDPDGVPMLRIMDLRLDAIDLATVTRIPQALSDEFRRTIVRSGDLVVSVVGTLGRSALVTPALSGANLNRPLARVQLIPGISRQLVQWWFESEGFVQQALSATAGDSAQPTLGLGDLKNFSVNLPLDPKKWSPIEDRLRLSWDRINAMRLVLARQVDLLVERRQVLVTAAVTGLLDAPVVAA